MIEIIIIFAGFASGFIGSTAGGGGAFVPFFVLISFGMPVHIAIGTNKMGNMGLFPLSIVNFTKAKKVNKKLATQLTLIGILGAIAGSFFVISISSELLHKIIATSLVILLFFYLRYQDIGLKERPPSPLWSFFYFLKTVYGGMFGAGSGIFAMATLTGLRGLKALEANANNMVASLFATLISVVIFLASGFVDYHLAFILFFGNLLGGFVGSKIAIKKGDKWVRLALIIVIIITIIRLLFK